MKLLYTVAFPTIVFMVGCTSVGEKGSAEYSPPDHSSISTVPDGMSTGVASANDLSALCSDSKNFQLPSGFATAALEECSGVYDEDVDNPNCPIRRKVVLVRIAPVKTSVSDNNYICGAENPGCTIPNDLEAVARFSTYLAGINRFEVVTTRMNLFNWSNELQLTKYAHQEDLLVTLKNNKEPRLVDYIVNISPVIRKIGNTGLDQGDIVDTTYEASFITQVLDPRLMTVSADIVVPEINFRQVKTSLLASKNGEINYRGYDPTDLQEEKGVYDDIYRHGLVTIASYLMQQFPAVARVTALTERFIVLDRGRLEGLSEFGETMLVFQKQRQVAVPILLAAVQPSQSAAAGGSQGTIACWGSSHSAKAIREVSREGEINGLDRKLYAVSVAPPAGKQF